MARNYYDLLRWGDILKAIFEYHAEQSMSKYNAKEACMLARSAIEGVLYALEDVPATEAEPVRHGRWIMRGGYFRCSECDAKALWERKGGTGGWSSEFEQAKTKICHNCGCKMDKGEE